LGWVVGGREVERVEWKDRVCMYIYRRRPEWFGQRGPEDGGWWGGTSPLQGWVPEQRTWQGDLEVAGSRTQTLTPDPE
jgi:hypothetical protein